MKNVLVVGAGAYQVPLIKRLRELGHTVYAIDGNPQAVGFCCASHHEVINVLDKSACLEYAMRICADAVMTYGATITLPTVSYIGKKMNLPALSEGAASVSTSKYEIKKRLFECGLNIYGRFVRFDDPKDAKGYPFEYPFVIKPTDGSGSKGVATVHDPSELDEALQYAFAGSRYGQVYCEGYIEGEEYSVEAFSMGEKAYVYSIVKTSFTQTDSEVDYGHRAPSGLSPEVEEVIGNQALAAIKALDINFGSVNMDVILSRADGKPYIIDVGIRIGQNLIASHLVPLSRGVSVIDNTIALALGERVDAEPKFQRCVATRLLIYNPGYIREIKPFSDVIGRNGVVDIVLRKGVGDYLPRYKEKSDTCGWVIAEGETPDEAELNARRAKDLLANYIVIEG